MSLKLDEYVARAQFIFRMLTIQTHTYNCTYMYIPRWDSLLITVMCTMAYQITGNSILLVQELVKSDNSENIRKGFALLFISVSGGSAMRHYDDVIMGMMASQITSLTIVYSTVYSGADQSKHQSSASLAFVWGIHRGLVNCRLDGAMSLSEPTLEYC